MSCRSAPKRSASPRVSSSASGSARKLRDSAGARRRRTAGRSRLDLEPLARAPRGCARARRGGGSGSGRRRAAPPARAARPAVSSSSSISASAAQRVGPGRASRAARRTGARPPGSAAAPACGAGQRRRSPASSSSSWRGRDARGAQQPQRVVRERRARRPRGARGPPASASPPVGSIGSPPASGTAIALTVKSRAPQVGLDRLGAQRGHVDVPARRRAGDAPARSRAPRRAGRRSRRPPRAIARAASSLAPRLDREVGVRDRLAEQRVADRAADDPDALLAAERLARRRDGRRGAEARLQRPAARSRRVRPRDPARDPAGDLVVDRLRAGAPAPRRGSRSEPCAPISTASSPGSTSVSGPRSMVRLSIETVPTSG